MKSRDQVSLNESKAVLISTLLAKRTITLHSPLCEQSERKLSAQRPKAAQLFTLAKAVRIR